MYAAAGGASLASRRKGKEKAAQNNKNKALLQQGLKDKLAADLAIKAKAQSRQFHNLPATYLRTPQAQARKLSAGYTTSSRLLLPINESNPNDIHNQSHHHHHHHHHHQHHHHTHPNHPNHRPLSPRSEHPPHHRQFHHYDKNYITKSATLPLVVSQSEPTPPTSPIVLNNSSTKPPELNEHHALHIQVQDSIIITPATPQASPGRTPTGEPNQLERKCSFHRERKLDTHETNLNAKSGTITCSHDQLVYTDEYQTTYNLPNGGQKWTDAEFCDSEHRHMGICTCDHVECAQGRAAWLERGRRCSVQDNSASCHRRWVKRNRIHDSSLGGSSDDDDFLGVLRGPSSFANAFLYVGLGTIAIGLVIAFVGTGEKGFKTVELRLIGPSLIGVGLVCCILRILFCICPSHCIMSSRRKLKKKNAKVDADHTTSLLRGDSKRVSIARGPQQKYPQSSKSREQSDLNEGMEALRQIATTSLFLQNEQNVVTNRNVPIIKEPDKREEAPLELKKIDDMSIEVCSISDDDDTGSHKHTIVEPTRSQESRPSKLLRTRAPVNQQKTKDSDTLLMETSLVTLNQSPILPLTHHSATTRPAPPLQATTTTTASAAATTATTSTILQLPSQGIFELDGHSSASVFHSQTTESELVLSPAKLGQ